MKRLLLLLLLSQALLWAQSAIIQTTAGTIEIELRPDIAPKASENFVKLAQKGYYNGIIFHRVIKNFMIQTGDPTGTGAGGTSIWGKPFEDEFSPKALFDKPGIVAMANRGPATNGSQFFITTVPTPWLNGYHTIFGRVSKGMETVRAIEKSPTDSQDRPIKPVKIVKITIKP
ncbi:MAG: peptidylprolyl isomerase [Campylobacterales bacterium]